MRVLHLVDDRNYAATNCFQHQLAIALHREHQVATFALGDVLGKKLEGDVDVVVSCLKQRTIYRNAALLREYLGDTPVVIYDQDPWEAFKDGGPFKGSYTAIMSQLNVKTFAVTTQWWADHISSQGIPCVFVPMWVLPKYCDPSPPWVNRQVPVGFIGSVHSYRFQLFEHLRQQGVDVNVHAGSTLGYGAFLGALSNIQIFVHSEDAPLTIDGEPTNMGTGLWIKDVEAAARGCFSIRNRLEGHETYLSGIETVRLYDNLSEVAGIIRSIQRMDPAERQYQIDTTVEHIRCANRWSETVATLTGEQHPLVG